MLVVRCGHQRPRHVLCECEREGGSFQRKETKYNVKQQAFAFADEIFLVSLLACGAKKKMKKGEGQQERF